MKNPASWVFGINLALYFLCMVCFPSFFVACLVGSFGLNFLIGLILSIAGKKDLGQIFL